MDDDPRSGLSRDDLVVPFIFVPHGAPDPVEWKAAHPGWVKFPATFIPRQMTDAEDVASAPPPPLPWRRFPGSASAGSPPDLLSLQADVTGNPLSLAATYGDPAGAANLGSSFWDQVQSVISGLFGIPDAQAQTPELPEEMPDEEPGRREEDAPELLPSAVRLEEYRQAADALKRLERDNPLLQSLTRPAGPIPEQAALDRLQAELAAARERAVHRLQSDRERPEGFPSQASLQQFSGSLQADLTTGGITDARIGLIGSSVTGRSYRTGQPFRPDSDLDVFVASRQLFDRVRTPLRGDGTRTKAIAAEEVLAKLGLPADTVSKLRGLAGRKVSIMIYRDLDSLLARKAPYMVLSGGDE